jgi:acetyl esterase/lipase
MKARWWVAAAGFAAVAIAAGRRVAALREVAPELRAAPLLVSVPVVNGPVVRLARRLTPAVAVRDGVRCETVGNLFTYEADGRDRPSGALVWIHGGGLVLGRAAIEHDECSRFAQELGILVVNVDYRLAPEDPYPAAIDDCFAALTWLHDHAAELGVDPARIAVGGVSAGGGLAAAVAQRARDEGMPVCFQLLIYPMLDDRTVLRAGHAGRGKVTWTPVLNRFGWTSYLGHPPRIDDTRPYAAPARREDLSGLPPAWIGVGDLDLFYEEDIDYAARLSDAGVDCELHTVARMPHGADLIRPGAASMVAFRQGLTAALGRHVG